MIACINKFQHNTLLIVICSDLLITMFLSFYIISAFLVVPMLHVLRIEGSVSYPSLLNAPPANPSWRIIRSRHLQHGMMLALTLTSCGRRAHAFASTTFSSPAPKFRLHMLRHISQVAVASRGRTFRTPCWPTGNLPSQPYLLQPPHRWPWP